MDSRLRGNDGFGSENDGFGCGSGWVGGTASFEIVSYQGGGGGLGLRKVDAVSVRESPIDAEDPGCRNYRQVPVKRIEGGIDQLCWTGSATL